MSSRQQITICAYTFLPHGGIDRHCYNIRLVGAVENRQQNKQFLIRKSVISKIASCCSKMHISQVAGGSTIYDKSEGNQQLSVITRG